MAKKKAKKSKKGRAKTMAAGVKRETVEVIGVDKDLLKQLDGRKGVTGGMWKPVVFGDALCGQVLSLTAEKGKYDKMQAKLIVGTPDGAITVYGNWSLQQGLIAEKVDVGDTIGIQYKTDVPGKGRPMRAFAVVRKGGKGKKAAEALTKIAETDKKGDK